MTNETDLSTAKRFNLRDGERAVTLMGWEIASADSQSGVDIRWTELVLYRTTSNRYVLEKIGRSDVFHSDRCTRRSKGKQWPDLESSIPDDVEIEDSIEEMFVPCPDCRPSYEESPVWVERDIHTVAVHETAQAAVDALHRGDTGAIRSISRVARSLLEAAGKVDPAIHAVLQAPEDVT